jgi:hypothetical protein
MRIIGGNPLRAQRQTGQPADGNRSRAATQHPASGQIG